MLDAAVTTAPRQPAVSPALSRPKVRKSRSTNVLHKLAGVDGNSTQGRRYADIVLALVAELGGEAALGEESRVQVRQVGALTIRLEEMQGALVRGEAVDLEAFTRMSNSLTRTLRALGIKRRAVRPKTLRERLIEDVANEEAAAR
jgi:hypothetical protein